MSKNAILGVILISMITGALGIAGDIVLSTQNAPNRTSMDQSKLPPALSLLGGGTKWAAGNGSLALFVDWKDNWLAHHLTDGSSWGPWLSESGMGNSRYSVYHALSQSGLNVEFAGDIPENLSRYDVVVIEAYWAVEPKHEPLIRNYVFDGGGVVLLAGVPPHFGGYCKDWWVYRLGLKDLSPIEEWFGAGYYQCADGFANITIDNPFGIPMLKGDIVFEAAGDNAAITLSHNDTQIIAQWQNPLEWRRGAFAFTHEYGQGRVYYQSTFEILSERALSIKLTGEFDYALKESVKIKIVALVRDASTMEPVSDANVAVQVYDDANKLWVSSVMTEKLAGTGVYEWTSSGTIKELGLEKGIYLVRAQASFEDGPLAHDVLLFHIDPPLESSVPSLTPLVYYLAAISVLIGGAAIGIALLRRRRKPSTRNFMIRS